MAGGALAQVGVEAVVASLGSFERDMGKIDKSIQSIIPGANLVEGAFTALGNVFEGVASFVSGVLQHALGELLADALQWVNEKIWSVIDSSIELAGYLQSLEIRLNTLNFNALIESGREFEDAMRLSKEQTQEQLEWIKKLALATPYTNEDIAGVYGMIRALGINDEEARDLVGTLGDFAAGMDLSADSMTGVVRQLTQMSRKGKIMQQDLNVLAENGVPVNLILDKMRDQMGMTVEEFDKFKKTGEGAQMFIETFTNWVDTNFVGAAERANRTFANATQTMQDFFASFIAGGLTKPVLDLLGESVAKFNDSLTKYAPYFTQVFGEIGEAVVGILADLGALAPSTDDMALGILSALNGVADWLTTNKDSIVNWIASAVDWFNNQLIPAIQSVWSWLFGSQENTGAIQSFGAWVVSDFLPVVKEVAQWIGNVLIPFFQITMPPLLKSLGELFGEVGRILYEAFTGEVQDSIPTLSQFIANLSIVVSELTVWLKENEDTMVAVVRTIGEVMLAIAATATFFLILIEVVKSVVFIFTGLLIPTFVWFAVEFGKSLKKAFYSLMNFSEDVVSITSFIATKFFDAGVNFVQGMIDGIGSMGQALWDAAWGIAESAYQAVVDALTIGSPSKLMMEVGVNFDKGLMEGILDASDMVAGAAQTVVAKMVAPTLSAPAMATVAAARTVSNNYATTNNFNMTVNTSANREPIIQDFNMMQSMVGA